MTSRKEIIDAFQRIIHLYSFDQDDSRFTDEIAKLLPVLTQFCQHEGLSMQDLQNYFGYHYYNTVQQSQQQPPQSPPSSESMDRQELQNYKLPNDQMLDMLPNTPATTETRSETITQSKDDVESAASSATSTTKQGSNNPEKEHLKKQRAKEYREIVRKSNPHLARARSLIARAKYIVGPNADTEAVKTKALELLQNPGRVPKLEYRFDDNGITIVSSFIKAWTPR